MVADLAILPSRLTFVVVPSPASNDHQARILIDGADWLGAEALGLDPPDLATELSGDSTTIRIGRCSCGAPGCDDRWVDRSELGERVVWITQGRTFHFNRPEYLYEVERFISDQSWRTVERRAEQAVEAIFNGALLEGRLAFQWASARIGRNLVHLSFIDGDEQRLLDFSWDGETVASAVERARQFSRERFEA